MTYAQQMDMRDCARPFEYENGDPSNVSVQKITGMNETLLENGYLQKTGTIEGLAGKLGVPAAVLVATTK